MRDLPNWKRWRWVSCAGLLCLEVWTATGCGREKTGLTGSLQIASPGNGAFLNAATIEIQVTSTDLVPDKVQLEVDGVLLDQVLTQAPFVFSWPASLSVEGQHTFVAKGFYGSTNALSVPVTVTTDRTAPTVVARQPVPAATNVDTHQPLTITFSEGMLEGSVPDGGITLRTYFQDGPNAGQNLVDSPGLEWSADRETLTLLPHDAPLIGGSIVTLPEGLTDLAGNALTLPSDAWGWDAAEYVYGCTAPAGLTARGTAVSSDSQYAYLISIDAPGNTVSVSRLEAGGTICSPLPSPGAGQNQFLASASSNGTLTLFTWAPANPPVASSHLLQQWDGSRWNTISDPPILNIAWPPLSLTTNDQGDIAMVTTDGSVASASFYAAIWHAGSWLVPSKTSSESVSLFSTVFTHDGALVIAASSPGADSVSTSTWSGSAWSTGIFGTEAQISVAPVLAETTAGLYAIAFQENGGFATAHFFNGHAWSAAGALDGPGYTAAEAYAAPDGSAYAGFIFGAGSDGPGAVRMEVAHIVDGQMTALDPSGAQCGTINCSLASDSSGRPIVVPWGSSVRMWNE